MKNLNLKTYLIAAVVVVASYYVGFFLLDDYLNVTQSTITFTALCVGWMILVGNRYDDNGDWDGGEGYDNSGDDDDDDDFGGPGGAPYTELDREVDEILYRVQNGIPPAAPAPAPLPTQTVTSANPVLERKKAFVAQQKLSGFTAEAAVIDHVLTTMKLPGQVDFTQPETIVLANTFASYNVTPTGTGILQFSHLESATDMIAREVKARLRKSDDEDVQVVAVNSQPQMTFQVTRRKPQPLLWDDRPNGLGELAFTLGYYWRGSKRIPLTINIGGTDSDYVTGALWGQPRAGKSTVLNVIVNTLCLNTAPEKIQFYGVDTHHDMWRAYSQLPHFCQDGAGKQTASDIDGAMETLDLFASWCDKHNAPSDGVARVLVIDEMQKILTHTKHGKVALERLRTIMAEGGKRLIRVITATQNPDSKSYPTELKPLTGWMAYTKITNDRYITHELRLPSARTLIPKKELNFYGPESTCRLSAFWLPPDENEKVIQQIAEKWKKDYTMASDGNGKQSYLSSAVSDTGFSESHTSIGSNIGSNIGSDNRLGAVKTSVPAGQAVAAWTARLDATTPWEIQNRPLSPAEAKRLREIADDPRFVVKGKRSTNAIIRFVWASGSNDKKLSWAKQALGD